MYKLVLFFLFIILNVQASRCLDDLFPLIKNEQRQAMLGEFLLKGTIARDANTLKNLPAGQYLYLITQDSIAFHMRIPGDFGKAEAFNNVSDVTSVNYDTAYFVSHRSLSNYLMDELDYTKPLAAGEFVVDDNSIAIMLNNRSGTYPTGNIDNLEYAKNKLAEKGLRYQDDLLLEDYSRRETLKQIPIKNPYYDEEHTLIMMELLGEDVFKSILAMDSPEEEFIKAMIARNRQLDSAIHPKLLQLKKKLVIKALKVSGNEITVEHLEEIKEYLSLRGYYFESIEDYIYSRVENDHQLMTAKSLTPTIHKYNRDKFIEVNFKRKFGVDEVTTLRIYNSGFGKHHADLMSILSELIPHEMIDYRRGFVNLYFNQQRTRMIYQLVYDHKNIEQSELIDIKGRRVVKNIAFEIDKNKIIDQLK